MSFMSGDFATYLYFIFIGFCVINLLYMANYSLNYFQLWYFRFMRSFDGKKWKWDEKS